MKGAAFPRPEVVTSSHCTSNAGSGKLEDERRMPTAVHPLRGDANDARRVEPAEARYQANRG